MTIPPFYSKFLGFKASAQPQHEERKALQPWRSTCHLQELPCSSARSPWNMRRWHGDCGVERFCEQVLRCASAIKELLSFVGITSWKAQHHAREYIYIDCFYIYSYMIARYIHMHTWSMCIHIHVFFIQALAWLELLPSSFDSKKTVLVVDMS